MNLALDLRKAFWQFSFKRRVGRQNQFDRHILFRHARVGDFHRIGQRLANRRPSVLRARYTRSG